MDPEPMDIDKSASSTSKMDMSFNDTDTDVNRPKSNIKTYHIKMQHMKKEPVSRLKYFTTGVLLLILSSITYQVMNFKCSEDIDLRLLRKSFTENLFGQSAAANEIIEALNMQEKSKIIFLYGGSGVGKTYITSFILEKIWNSANVYHYTMPTFATTFSPELMLGLTVCKTSILVVDDLKRDDMHITSHIKNVIAKSKKLKNNITVILVYNCDTVRDNFIKKCDNSFQKELEQSFGFINAEKYFIQFQPLKQEHLKKCIDKELGYRKVSGQVMNKIMKNFDVSLDGCKGVYKKIKFLNVL